MSGELQFHSLGDEKDYVNSLFSELPLLPSPPPQQQRVDVQDTTRFAPLSALERKDPQLNPMQQLVFEVVADYRALGSGLNVAPTSHQVVVAVKKRVSQNKNGTITHKSDIHRALTQLKEKNLIYYRPLSNVCKDKVWFVCNDK